MKTAIITGGASGLGYAIATEFIKRDISVAIIGRNVEKLQQAERKLGKNCRSFQFDLTELDKLGSLIDEIRKTFNSIDILVNNAGIHLKKPMLEVSNEEFQKVIQTNLTAVFAMSREVGKIMVQQKSGCILNISSMAAKYGIPQVIGYTAAKTGIEGMTRAMAVELSPLGIRVNCIAPGFIKTNMSSGALDSDPERKRKVLSRTPMNKLGTPEDVGKAAYFLVSEESEFITGTILSVDGGNAIGF